MGLLDSGAIDPEIIDVEVYRGDVNLKIAAIDARVYTILSLNGMND